jgi:hypothetical protein
MRPYKTTMGPLKQKQLCVLPTLELATCQQQEKKNPTRLERGRCHRAGRIWSTLQKIEVGSLSYIVCMIKYTTKSYVKKKYTTKSCIYHHQLQRIKIRYCHALHFCWCRLHHSIIITKFINSIPPGAPHQPTMKVFRVAVPFFELANM